MSAPGSPFQFGAVILAAGGSRRMGSPKQLLSWQGKSLIRHVTEEALGTRAWPVVVVVGAAQEAIRAELASLPVLYAANPAWESGIGSSIRTGVQTIQAFSPGLGGALMALSDQPFFSAQVVAELCIALESSDCLAAASAYGGTVGVPALFRRSLFSELMTLSADQGARNVLARHAGQVAAVKFPQLGADVDTPEDYQRLIKGR